MGVALSPLPFHPLTGLQALGFTRRGPVWPVMGASEDGGDPEPQPEPQNEPPTSDKGFPEGTPVAEMTDAQKAAYYRFQNRQTDNKLSAFKGVTPQDVETMRQELESLRTERLSADEKALKEATEKAATEARQAAEATLLPKYQAAQLKSAAAQVITDKDQLASFMAVTDPAKFVGEDGEIDEDKVMGHLTAIFGTRQTNGQSRSWGQHSGTGANPGARPGDGGRAEAAKRFGTKTTT